MTVHWHECPLCTRMTMEEENGEWCIFCFYNGDAFRFVLSTEERASLLTRIRLTDGVIFADVYHHANNAFVLLVTLEDGRTIYCGTQSTMISVNTEEGSAEESTVVVPLVPPAGAAWGLVVLPIGSGDAVQVPQGYSDEELPVGILELISLNNMMQ